MRIFRKSVQKIHVSLKPDENKRYFTWRPKYIYTIPRSFTLIMRNIADKSCRENQNTHFVLRKIFFKKIVPFMRKCGKILYSEVRHRWQYGACALHAGYLRLQMHIRNVKYSLLIHSNNGCTNAPQCYVISTMPVMFLLLRVPCRGGWIWKAATSMGRPKYSQKTCRSATLSTTILTRTDMGSNPALRGERLAFSKQYLKAHFLSYRKHILFWCKYKLFIAAYINNRYLMVRSYKTNQYDVWAEWRVPNFDTGGTHNYHCG